MENWEGTLSLVLIFRGCLGLMGRSEHRRLLERVVWEANLKADGRGACENATAAALGQSRAVEWSGDLGSRQGGQEVTLGRNTWPHSTPRPGRLGTHVMLLVVCFLSATF